MTLCAACQSLCNEETEWARHSMSLSSPRAEASLATGSFHLHGSCFGSPKIPAAAVSAGAEKHLGSSS